MPHISEIIEKVRSGIISIRFYKDGKKVATGSGFLYNGHIVSNSHVFNPGGQPFSPNTEVGFKFGDTGQFMSEDFKILFKNLKLLTGSHESSNDYAVYDIPEGFDIKDRYMFKIGTEPAEGTPIILIGYPFGKEYMTTSTGIVSAIYQEGSINCIQVDASVNQGNSGGPLLDLLTGEVLGIITRKETGLRDFDILLNNLKKSIDTMQKSRSLGSAKIMGVDPIESFSIIYEQMKHIAQNIERSSNTGIGIAFSCKALKNDTAAN